MSPAGTVWCYPRNTGQAWLERLFVLVLCVDSCLVSASVVCVIYVYDVEVVCV